MPTKPTVYLESSVICYLTNNPSNQLIEAAHQNLTHEWWKTAPNRFRLHVSETVITEIRGGEPELAQRRLKVIDGLPVLQFSQEAEQLSNLYLQEKIFPAKARVDSIHVAIAVVHGLDCVVSWNCRHIANAQVMGRLIAFNQGINYLKTPALATPEQLQGETDYGN